MGCCTVTIATQGEGRMAPKLLESPRRLMRSDDVANFDCGKNALNDWLTRFAWQNQQAGTSVTYVVLSEQKVVAYYSIATGSVAPAEATKRVAKGVGKLAIPVILLARLAVDKALPLQGRGVGYSLLQDVLIRSIGVSSQVGFRAVVVDALDDEARQFYLKHGFGPSPIDEMRLMLMLKDVKRSLGL